MKFLTELRWGVLQIKIKRGNLHERTFGNVFLSLIEIFNNK
jgi:hypothetical protein